MWLKRFVARLVAIALPCRGASSLHADQEMAIDHAYRAAL
jgi:hypothetical protein